MNKKTDIQPSFDLKGYELKKKEFEDRRFRKVIEKIKAEDREKTLKEKRAKNDLRYAKIIFDWARRFRESTDGKRTISLVPTSWRPDRSLTFFEWHPGWSYSLDLSGEKIRWYRFGPGSEEFYCSNPKELAFHAQNAPRGMLKACCEAIKNGDVWKWIKKDIDCLLKP